MKARKFSREALSVFNEIQIHYKRPPVDSLIKVNSSEDADAIVRSFIDPKRIDFKEFFIAIFLSNANHVLGVSEVSVGGAKGTVTNYREVIQIALLTNSSAIVVSHNHPSGSLKPSRADIEITKSLKKVVKILDIELLDHLILTSEGYRSMADHGDL